MCTHLFFSEYVHKSIYQRLSLVRQPVVPSSKRLCLELLLLLFLFPTGGKQAFISLCSGPWEKKIPHQCSGLQPLKVPLLLLLLLFSYPSLLLHLNLSPQHTHIRIYHVIHLLHHHWCLWSWRVSNRCISPEINISEAEQPGWCS